MDLDDFNEAWEDLVGLPAEPPEMREKCPHCKRPVVVCWCGSLASVPVETRCRVIVLQHPAEEKRCLRTADMLRRGLAPGKCTVFRGKKFPSLKHVGLKEWLSSEDCLVIYPSKDSVEVEEIPTVAERGRPYNLILIDGTWPQAKAIFHNTTQLHSIKQVKFRNGGRSSYVIRTQPADGCLSTLEAASRALSILEATDYSHTLLPPLHRLCQFQLDHGAVTHDSTDNKVKENQKRIGRRLERYLKQFPSRPVPA